MNKIVTTLTRDLGLKAIALVIACVIWVFVTNSNNPVRSITITNVPINLLNEDSIADIGKVAEPAGTDMVTLKVTERRSVLNRLNRSNFNVTADLENINEMDSVPLTVTCDNSAVTWDEIQISPSSLKVNVEDKVEQPFAISVVSTGEVAAGYAVGKTEIEGGKTILIAGPASLVDIIGQVNAPVSVSNLNDDKSLSSTLRVYDKNGAELTEGQMNRLEFKTATGDVIDDYTITVDLDLWEVRTDMPLKVEAAGIPANGYRVGSITAVPATVTLAATAETFEEIGPVLTVLERVSVDGLSEDDVQEIDLSSTLDQYENVKLPPDTDSVISVQIGIKKTGYSTVDIPLSDIILLNRPENRKLVFTPADKITISVKADNSDYAPITAERIEAVMDLMECEEPGAYDIPVAITLPEGYTLSDEVIVKVSSSETDTEDGSGTDIRSASGTGSTTGSAASGEKDQDDQKEADTES